MSGAFLELKLHADAAGAVGVRWIPGAAEPPFHGAWLPSADPDELRRMLDRVPGEVHRSVRIVRDDGGWYLLLFSGHLAEALTPWPLRRIGDGPFVFHPAEAAPVPSVPPGVIARAGGGKSFVGRVENGQILWSRWDTGEARTPGELLRLPIDVTPFATRTSAADGAPPAAFPAFLSEELPKPGRLESEERRRLQSLQDPPQSFWSKLFKRNQPPSSLEWNDLMKTKESAIRRGIRSFWNWVDRKIGPRPPGAETGFIRKMFDPDQWNFNPRFLKSLFDRQAQMFDRLAKLFERGDLDLALKHSIPIDNDLVNAMKQGGQLSLSWQLPENLVDYSFGSLTSTGTGPSVPTSADRIAHMAALYRKAAERLSSEGRHRQAAYVYAHLLKEYHRAADELEKGGFHLEAATLIKEKLGKPILAAQVLERGGFIPEAVELYLKEKAFEPAVEACERAGMKEEAERCLRRWLEDLRLRGENLKAGDLLRDRLKKPDEARTLYQAELRTPRGFRGQAGGRLVALEIDGGRTDLHAWEECEEVLGSELRHADRFVAGMNGLVTFHREVRQWSRERTLPAPVQQELFRKSRASLMSAVREAQRANNGEARGPAVEALSELLGDGEDPLAVQDLRRGLAIGLDDASRRRPLPRRRSAGILPLPGGGFFCWVRNTWAQMDGSGSTRSRTQPLGSLVVSAAVHPKAASDGGATIALVAHDHRVSVGKMAGGTLTILASSGVPGALSIVAEPDQEAFLIGTSHGSLLRATAPAPRILRTKQVFLEPEAGPLRWLGWWVEGAMLIACGDQPWFEGLLRENAEAFARTEPLPSQIGFLEPPAPGKANALAFCLGRGRDFGLLRHTTGEVERLIAPDVPYAGITSTAWVDPDSSPSPLVVLGYEDGRIAVTELSIDGSLSLQLERMFPTSLGAIVALRGVDHGRVVAVDVDFNCAILDTRTMALTYQGAWTPA